MFRARYFAFARAVPLNTVSGGLQEVTIATSESDSAASGDMIAAQAERLRARRALGRSDPLNRLFDFLAQSAAAGVRPKELEVAIAVFGRDSRFDGAGDATVRVAVHRLRRKLDDFYSGPGEDEPVRLSIPLGEYRMIAEPRPAASPESGAAFKQRRPLLALGIVALALNLAAWGVFTWTQAPERLTQSVQGKAPWAALAASDAPTLLVLGDYYIFGEIDVQAGVDRLIRQYSINSAADLDDWLMDNPKAVGKYRDLDLYYLPVGAAFAMRSVVPILAHLGHKAEGARVIMASDLTPEMLKHNNIVYVGYFSGLGILRAPVFIGSGFSIGETYDEVVDDRTHRVYRSQAGGPGLGDASRRDYGYLAAFRGPTGNRIVIVAGARDTGLQEAADAVSKPESLKALARAAGSADAFEALYEVEGLGRSTLGSRLLIAKPRGALDPWTSQRPLNFPQG